jgi:uncharacterized membrane protein
VAAFAAAGAGQRSKIGTFINRLEPKGTGTDLTMELTYELPAGFLGAVLDKVFVERAIERDLRFSAENFKAFCEAKVPVLA